MGNSQKKIQMYSLQPVAMGSIGSALPFIEIAMVLAQEL